MSIEVRSEEEIVKEGISVAERILVLMTQIAEIRADIKIIKTDAKLDGIPVGLIDKAIVRIKKEMKQTETDKFEEDAWYEKLIEQDSITNAIANINSI